MFQLNHDSACKEEKQKGDLVFLGDNAGEVFEVIYIYCDKAWVRHYKWAHIEYLCPVSRLRLHQRKEVRLVA